MASMLSRARASFPYLSLLSILVLCSTHAFAAGSISGNVTEGWAGYPLPGVTLEAYDLNWDLVKTGVTDDSGDYAISDLAPGYYFLHAAANMDNIVDAYYGQAGTNTVPVRGNAEPLNVTDGGTVSASFILANPIRGAQTISGKVTWDQDGTGIGGVLVIAYYQNDSDGDTYSDWAYTDASGAYQIAGLMDPISFCLKTYNTLGFVDEYYNNAASHAGATSVYAAANADFSLASGGFVSGRVTRESDGAGIVGIEVQAQEYSLLKSSQTNYPLSARTDHSGYYTIPGLRAGNYFVSTTNAAQSLFADEYYDDAGWWDPTPVTVDVGVETANIDFSLAPAGSIVGSVVSETTGSGIYLAGVMAYDTHWNPIAQVSTDGSGGYAIQGLPSGSYYVRVMASDHIGKYSGNVVTPETAEPVVIRADPEISVATEANFVLSRGGSISGSVSRSADGSVVSSFSIRVYDGDWRLLTQRFFYSASGQYSIAGLLPGSYYVEAIKFSPVLADEYYGGALVRSAATKVEVSSGANTPSISFSLDDGKAVSGRVTRATDGAGISGVQVSAYNSEWELVRTQSTDAGGNYSIPGLAPGQYFLFTNQAPGYAEEYFDNALSRSAATAVTVPGDANTTGIDFVLDESLSIAGTVSERCSSRGIGGIRVNAYDASREFVASAITDPEGAYIIGGLPAGTYYVGTEASEGFTDQYHHNAASVNAARPVYLIQDPYFVDLVLAPTPVPETDFDQDGKSDITVWRESTGIWYSSFSGEQGGFTSAQWGAPGDMAVPGDYDGDGKADLAVWRPGSGTWFILSSGSPDTYRQIQWGDTGDEPVPGDYDGDGKTDLAVRRGASSIWFILPSSIPDRYIIRQWGLGSDVPVVGRYDEDNKADIAVWRPDNGVWFVLPSESPGFFRTTQWGEYGDIPVAQDYDGDGQTDIAVWRPSAGMWFVVSSKIPEAGINKQWGQQTDIPVPEDYDGDKAADFAVWRPDVGVWFILPSGSPESYLVKQWGAETDVPISGTTKILNAMP